jgi:hypothetical protein
MSYAIRLRSSVLLLAPLLCALLSGCLAPQQRVILDGREGDISHSPVIQEVLLGQLSEAINDLPLDQIAGSLCRVTVSGVAPNGITETARVWFEARLEELDCEIVRSPDDLEFSDPPLHLHLVIVSYGVDEVEELLPRGLLRPIRFYASHYRSVVKLQLEITSPSGLAITHEVSATNRLDSPYPLPDNQSVATPAEENGDG